MTKSNPKDQIPILKTEMDQRTSLSSPSYWAYALLSWIAIYFLTLAFPKLVYSTESLLSSRNLYIICETLSCGIVGFICSLMVLYPFEKYWKWEKINKKLVLTLVLLFIISQVIYSIAIWPILRLLYEGILGESKVKIDTTIGLMINNFAMFSFRFIVWFSIIFIYKGYLYITQTKIHRLELETNLNKSRLNTLKGQINPHFMFNSLNNIRGLMLEDVPKSREMLTKLSEMLRFSLNGNDTDLVPLEDEIEIVDNYISLAKIQFEKRLNFTKDITPELYQAQIPPMTIQLLVENAVKHGISNLKNGGIIELKVFEKGQQIWIEVKNSGKLQVDKESTKLGLENIKTRLHLLFGDQATFHLEEIENEVLATVKIPTS